jgi:hypothetical protein
MHGETVHLPAHVRHPPTYLQISSSYFSLTHSIKTRPLSLHAGQYFVRLSGPMVQCSRLPKRSKLLRPCAWHWCVVVRDFSCCTDLNYIGYHDLYPPTRVCQSLECTNYRVNDEVATLTDPLAYRASLFTLRDGALPVHSVSTYCRGTFLIL